MDKPVKKFFIKGVNIAIWENKKQETNDIYYTVSVDRRYKNGEEWKSSNSFRINEIPRLLLGLNEAYKFLNFKDSNGT